MTLKHHTRWTTAKSLHAGVSALLSIAVFFAPMVTISKGLGRQRDLPASGTGETADREVVPRGHVAGRSNSANHLVAADPGMWDDRRFASRDDVIQAIAAQDRELAGARARMSEAAAGETAAEAEYKLAKEQMESAVAAELRRTPRLSGSERKLYAQEMPAEVATELASRRQRLAEMQRTLEVIRRDDELKKAAGLATNNRTRPLLEYSIPLVQDKIGWLTTLAGSLARTHAPREHLH